MNVTTTISEGGTRITNNKTFSPGSDVNDMNYIPHSPGRGIWDMNNATSTLVSEVRGMEISTLSIESGIRGIVYCNASTWRWHQVTEP